MSQLASIERSGQSCITCGQVSVFDKLFSVGEFDVLRCAACGLVLLNVPKDEETLKKLYSRSYFEERRAYFFENSVTSSSVDADNETIREFRQALQDLQVLNPNRGHLLDVGCGIGVFVALAEADGWKARGIDVSEFASRHAREQLGLDVAQGTLETVSLAEESFDVVTMWDVLEHMPDPAKELQAARRILKRDGYLLLNTPNEAGLQKIVANLVYRSSFGHIRYPLEKLYHIYHLYYFTPDTLRKLLEHAGFRILRLQSTCIPIDKGRASTLEKMILRVLSKLERLLGREFQLSVIVQKT